MYIAKARVQFKINTKVLKLTLVHFVNTGFHLCNVTSAPPSELCFLYAQNLRSGQLVAGDFASVWTFWDRSPHWALSALCGLYRLSWNRASKTTNMHRYVYTCSVMAAIWFRNYISLHTFDKHRRNNTIVVTFSWYININGTRHLVS